jgi:two-component system, OmpR family, KDP operon response regulator KdpE
MALVLVVDDEANIRTLLRETLEGAGHRVITADDGQQGLRAYHANHPDVVITDIFMPRRSGVDLVLELGRLHPVPKIIAMSGAAGPEFLDASREASVARTLTKPFDVQKVLRPRHWGRQGVFGLLPPTFRC